MHIAIQKEAYARTDSEAQVKLEQLSAKVRRDGGALSLVLADISGATASMVLTVPPSTKVTLTSNHGDVHVEGIQAAVNITANHGEVAVSNVTGSVVAHTNHSGSSFSAHGVTGGLTLEGHGDDITLSDVRGAVSLVGDFYGTTHFEHLGSAVKFHTSRTDLQMIRLDGEMEISPDAELSADQVVGPVVLTTRNRNINLERVAGDVSISNRNGSVELTSAPPLGNVTVENRNGSVTLTLPAHSSFGVSAETTDGDLENDFSLSHQENNGRKTLSGTIGDGGAVVHVTTSQGDVSLKQATISPLPPRPPNPPAVAQPLTPGAAIARGNKSHL